RMVLAGYSVGASVGAVGWNPTLARGPDTAPSRALRSWAGVPATVPLSTVTSMLAGLVSPGAGPRESVWTGSGARALASSRCGVGGRGWVGSVIVTNRLVSKPLNRLASDRT